MDFKMYYTPEQEEFRKEVAAWIRENVPEEMIDTAGSRDNWYITPEELRWAREFHRKRGEKGWLDPLLGKEYGGAGLPVEECAIISEEFANFREQVGRYPSPADLGVSLGIPAIAVYGTEEQKALFLPDIISGKVITWQLFTEPDAGTDLAGIKSTAVWNEEEQVWIVNGSKQFGGGPFFEEEGLMPAYGYGPFATEPDAPRHQNLTTFLIPMDLPGITPNRLDLLSGGWRDITFFDNVRLPDEYRLGQRGQGWRVLNATLEREHGGGGAPSRHTPARDDLFDYIKERGFVRDDPEAQEALMDYFLVSEVGQLFSIRNYWMRSSHQRWHHEGSQNSEYGKSNRAPQADRLLDIMGPQALLDHYDPLSILEGRTESAQRGAQGVHAGGTIEAQKIIMSRRMGLGRPVRARAAVVA